MFWDGYFTLWSIHCITVLYEESSLSILWILWICVNYSTTYSRVLINWYPEDYHHPKVLLYTPFIVCSTPTMATTKLHLSQWFYLSLLDFKINETLQYALICFRLLSLRIMLLRFIHVVACYQQIILSIAEHYSIYEHTIIFFIYITVLFMSLPVWTSYE